MGCYKFWGPKKIGALCSRTGRTPLGMGLAPADVLTTPASMAAAFLSFCLLSM